MSTSPRICAAAAGVILIGLGPAMAAPEAPSPPSAAATAPAPQPTPLSGVDIVLPKPAPTPLSGVDVVARKATPVSGVEVALPLCTTANPSPDSDIPPPKVVSTYPPKGAVVRPGLLVLRVTFDRPMTCVGLLDADSPWRDPCPAPLRDPMISHDRRTFLTLCKIDKDRRYGLVLKRFNSLGGRSAAPYELAFETSQTPEIATVDEAIAQDRWLQTVTHPGS